MTSGASGNCQIGDYMTHPSFISFDTKGFWVGKFETGYKGSTDILSAEKNTKEPEKVQIKPNVNSWRSIQVANAYLTSFDYKRNLDSHMMKNTEWGAVAYLQHSRYGSMSSVRFNNNSNRVTGYSAVLEPTCGLTGDNRDCNRYGYSEDITKPWNTSVGYLASTTGNISGIYDMSGGAIERVMGVVSDKNGNPIVGYDSNQNSGFNGVLSNGTRKNDGVSFPSDSKYYDIYQYNTNQQSYLKRILGDATGEMGPFANVIYGTQNNTIGSWYDDASRFVCLDNPWFQRGGGIIQGSHAGMFYFVNFGGQAGNTGGFRLILSI